MIKQRANASIAGIVLFLFATTLSAQVTEEWVARYDGPASSDDYAIAIAIDDAGNVYVTGWSYGSGTNRDYATVRYNSAGTEQWVARYDGPGNGDDYACAIAVDGSGNVYVTGDSNGSSGYYDYATVKYSSAGIEQWVARYNGPGNAWDYATSIALDDAGNVYVTGVSDGSGTEDYDYATVKYNPAGVQEWVARYNGPGDSDDNATSIAVDGSGNVYVTGSSWGSSTFRDYATVKYSPSGVQEWVARYDGPWNNWDGDAALAIALDDAGNVYVTGYSRGSGGNGDYATVRYNSAGEEQWVARYDGPASGGDVALAIALDDSSNVYVTGESISSGADLDYATVKYNPSGVQQWVARYDGPASRSDGSVAIAIDGAGNVYVTGVSVGSETDYDYATVKYSQGPGVAEASPDVPGHRLEVAQLTPEPVITYTLPSSSSISLKVYDVTGKLVETLVSGSQEAGTHTVTWDGRDEEGRKLSSGLYFIRVTTPRSSRFAKVVMLR